MRIDEDLGRFKTISEVHASRTTAYWFPCIPERVRQKLELELHLIMTDRDLVAMLEGLASGEIILRYRT